MVALAPMVAPFPYPGASVISTSYHGTSRVDHVGEYTAGPEEYVVFAGHTFVDRDVVLHLDILAQNHAGRYDHVLANVAVFAQNSARHDVAEVPNLGTFSDACSFIDGGGFVSLILHGMVRLGLPKIGKVLVFRFVQFFGG